MADQSPQPGARKRARRELPFHRRHRLLLTLVIGTVVVVLGAVGGYAYVLNSKFKNIDRVDVSGKLKEADRPDPDQGKALNILLLGSDKGKKIAGEPQDTTLAEDAQAATWPNGKYRSDTIMVVHITADRKHVYLVSIPRDTYTMLYDAHGNPTHKEKVNAAFSYYGPTGAISTIEHLTNLRLNHLAIIDWDGFKDLSTALGGVRVYIKQNSYDDAQHIQWTKGWHTLKGKEALAYVRTRHGLVRGDFDRIARQQNFLRAMMSKLLDSGTTHNPVRLNNALEAITQNLTVDSEWSTGDMRSLALSLRSTSADDVTFMTVPVSGTETIPVWGSIVDIDVQQSTALFEALRNDTMDAYLAAHPDSTLADPDSIS